MHFEHPHTPPTPETIEKDPVLIAAAERFLGDEASYLSPEAVDTAIKNAELHKETLEATVTSDKPAVSYDKHKKSFFVEGAKVTPGQIIASRHLGFEFAVPTSLEQSGEGKRLRKKYITSVAEDHLFNQLNYSLADTLSQDVRKKDMLKAKAYGEIRDRSNIESKQLGVLAEKVVTGFAEMIAIDRPDLGLTVTPGNAFLDVEQKIDFILETTHKKRGVGVEAGEVSEEHKSVGIQFTINTSKEESKLEQITKARERGMAVDDIIYVAIDQKTLKEALGAWEQAGKPLSGPMQFLPKQTQRKAISELFNNVLTEEQKQSLLKAFA